MDMIEIVKTAAWVGVAGGVIAMALALAWLVTMRLRAATAVAAEPPALGLPFGFC
jgi:hypothetical protein